MGDHGFSLGPSPGHVGLSPSEANRFNVSGISVLSLWLQSVWSLPSCVCKSHHPPGGEALVPEGQLGESWQEQLGLLYPQLLSLLLLFNLVSLTSVFSNCLSLLFGLRKGLKLETFSTKGKQGTQRGFCARAAPRSCWVSEGTRRLSG